MTARPEYILLWRNAMSSKIDTVTARAKLKCRREPYWQKISQGCFLGFRKMTSDAAGVWQVRYRTEDGNHITRTLGKFEDHAAHGRFDVASSVAEEWINHLNVGGTTDTVDVMDACVAYVQKIRELKGDKAAEDLQARYRRWVAPDPIRRVQLTKAKREHFAAFRKRVNEAPVEVGNYGVKRPRSKDTVNRDIAAVRAALNQALKDGKATSDFAWRAPLAAFKNVSKRRDLYLDREQRKRLIDTAAPDLAIFLRGLSMLPLRPGAGAALLVADFNVRFHVLRIGTDKSGGDRKFRVPSEIGDFLTDIIGGRPVEEPLFVRDGGLAWNKDAWKDPLKLAAAKAGLPPNTVATSIRHSVITDLVHGGLDLLTVAQLSGTSVAMIEKHYGHLRGEVAAVALGRLML